MRKAKVLLSLFGLVLLASAFAHAGIIYDNGGPNQQNGNEMTEWVQTEDFTFGAAQTITDIHFWDIDTGAYAGSISWWIVGDIRGVPDFNNILASGSTDVTRTATGNCVFFGCEYENSWDIAALTLGPGTYHLALHNGSLDNMQRSEFYWETTNLNNTTTGLECNLQNGACFGSWFNNGQEHAFYLTGTSTPEPGSLLLLGTGVIGLGGVIRRKLNL